MNVPARLTLTRRVGLSALDALAEAQVEDRRLLCVVAGVKWILVNDRAERRQSRGGNSNLHTMTGSGQMGWCSWVMQARWDGGLLRSG